MQQERALFIIGPTASGKSGLAKYFTKKYKIKIVNADVAQMYSAVTVGTAKPVLEEDPDRGLLFDKINDPANYSVLNYRKEVEKLNSKYFNFAYTGGCFFYIKNLFFSRLGISDVQQRVTVAELAYAKGLLSSSDYNLRYDGLIKIDYDRAIEINRNDNYRIDVALKTIVENEVKPSWLKEVFAPIAKKSIILALVPSKNILVEKIKLRTREMLPLWIKEVNSLKGSIWQDFVEKRGFIGYKELFAWIENGSVDEEEIIEEISRQTWNYAKRQICFWKGLKRKLDQFQEHANITIVESENIERLMEMDLDVFGFERW